MDKRQSAYKRANIGQVLGSFNSACHIVIHKLLDHVQEVSFEEKKTE